MVFPAECWDADWAASDRRIALGLPSPLDRGLSAFLPASLPESSHEQL